MSQIKFVFTRHWDNPHPTQFRGKAEKKALELSTCRFTEPRVNEYGGLAFEIIHSFHSDIQGMCTFWAVSIDWKDSNEFVCKTRWVRDVKNPKVKSSLNWEVFLKKAKKLGFLQKYK